MKHKLIDSKTRKVIKPGDTITDFHGDKAVFTSISKVPNSGSSGKILVVGGSLQREYFPNVFGLEIVGE